MRLVPVCRSKNVHRAFSMRGIYPPIATPFNRKTFELDLKSLEFNLERLRIVDFSGYVVLGSNGEYLSLSTEETCALVETAVQFAYGKPVIAGAGCESTAHTISRCRAVAAVGASAVLIVTPHYYRNQYNHKALVQHFQTVADNSPVPVVLYNVPKLTNLDLSAEAIIDLSSHPNIVGIKESHPDLQKIKRLVQETPEDFQIIAGSAGFLLPALHLGASGCVPATGNVLGKFICKLYAEYMQNSKSSILDNLQEQLNIPNDLLTRQFGVPGLKYAMELFGYKVGPPRPPLLTLDNPADQKLIRTALEPFRQEHSIAR